MEPTQVKNYVKTTDQQKRELIDMIINEKYSISMASKLAGINVSTAKYIFKAYKADKKKYLRKIKPKKSKIIEKQNENIMQNDVQQQTNIIQNGLMAFNPYFFVFNFPITNLPAEIIDQSRFSQNIRQYQIFQENNLGWNGAVNSNMIWFN